MTKTRILLTGADTLTGSQVLAQLLSYDDFSVRAVVRSAQAAQVLQRHRRSDSATLDCFTVAKRQSTTPGNLAPALHDPHDPFHAVVHILEAQSSDEADCLARFIKIDTETIIDFLRSVQHISPAVHSDRLPGHASSERSSSSASDGDYILAASQASKNVINDAVLSWIRESRAQFDLVFITAPSIYGPAVHSLENSSDLTETNRRIWNVCSNEFLDQAVPSMHGLDHFADVRDVADAAVRSLFISKASNKCLVLSAGVMPSGSEIARLIVASFPELQGRVKLKRCPPRRSHNEDPPPPLDFLETYLLSTVLGITKLRSAEATITDTVRQMLDLQRRKAWRSITQD
ncbi:hypothetical protein ACEQ8H_001239 [Pleosporales sp. CAS-2024a]